MTPREIVHELNQHIIGQDDAKRALMVKEAGGIVNDLSEFNANNINIKASSSAIYDKMLENLVNF